MVDNKDMTLINDDLVNKLKPIVHKFKELQTQAKALGIFTNHRDLVECSDCGLVEDVTNQGVLFVYCGENYSEDTGLRFIELDDDTVKCPKCGKVFCLYEK